jgi:hypothetical protein
MTKKQLNTHFVGLTIIGISSKSKNEVLIHIYEADDR